METPSYLFSRKEIINNFKYFQEKLSKVEHYYALKANANIEILEILKQEGCHFEAASMGEFNLLLDLGNKVENIIFGLPIKPEKMIIDLVSKGCNYFVFDSLEELEKLERYAPASRKILRIYVTDLIERCIPYGMRFNEIEYNIKENDLIKRMDGISFHITTNNNISDTFQIFERIEAILKSIRESRVGEFVLNIGGGYPTRKDDDYFEKLNDRLNNLINEYDISIYAEPGRSIVNSAGKYVSEIILIKKYDDYYDLYIDGGEPHGIHFAKKLRLFEEKEKNKRIMCRIISMTCQHKIIGMSRLSQEVQVGDHIVFDNCGAYTLCERSDFHLWNKPKIKLV